MQTTLESRRAALREKLEAAARNRAAAVARGEFFTMALVFADSAILVSILPGDVSDEDATAAANAHAAREGVTRREIFATGVQYFEGTESDAIAQAALLYGDKGKDLRLAS